MPTSKLDDDGQSASKSKLSSLSRIGKLVPTSWPNFSKIFMVSALTGDGVEDLKVNKTRNENIIHGQRRSASCKDFLLLDQIYTLPYQRAYRLQGE